MDTIAQLGYFKEEHFETIIDYQQSITVSVATLFVVVKQEDPMDVLEWGNPLGFPVFPGGIQVVVHLLLTGSPL